MSKDNNKTASREKKKGSNGGVGVREGGEGGTGSGGDGVKSEPMEGSRNEDDVKEEPPSATEEPKPSEHTEDSTPSDVKPPDLLADCE